MNLLRRFGFFISGFSIGLIILAVFLRGKKTSCDYGPNARTIKTIMLKPKVFSADAIHFLKNHKIDSTIVEELIASGNVNFTKSETHLDSCNIYYVENKYSNKPISIIIRNCEEKAFIDKLNF